MTREDTPRTTGAPQPAPRPRRAHRPRGARRGVAVALLAATPVALGWCAWLGADALRARDALEASAADVDRLREQVVAGDRAAAAVTLASLRTRAAVARSATDGPHWDAAAALPVVGPNVEAVATVARVVDDLAADALAPLLDAASAVDPTALAPVDGRIDLAPVVAVAPAVVAADDAVQHALATVAAIDRDDVVPALATRLAVLDEGLAEVAGTTSTAARAVRLLPPMLGADGPRHYLVLVQNNAELRATGGIPGSVVLLRADDGAVEVVGQRTGGSLGDLAAPVVELTAAERATFGEDLAADMRDVTFTPDFPRSGEIARAIWQGEVGGDVDGVLSLDPGALAHVLGATGPVALPTGQELTTDNAVGLLLNTVYLEMADPADQDRFFAATADAVFEAVASGRGSAGDTVAALSRSAREGRLMVWSAHPEEQALIEGTVLGGELRGAHGDSPVVGVYLNDAIPAKMGFYLRGDVRSEPTGCTPDGTATYTVTVDLTSTAPADAAALPAYVTGTEPGFPRGDLQSNVLVYAPAGGRVETVRVDGAPAGVFAQTHDGLGVVGRTVQLAPGASTQVAVDVVAGPGQTGVPVLRTTPLTSGSTSSGAAADCS